MSKTLDSIVKRWDAYKEKQIDLTAETVELAEDSLALVNNEKEPDLGAINHALTVLHHPDTGMNAGAFIQWVEMSCGGMTSTEKDGNTVYNYTPETAWIKYHKKSGKFRCAKGWNGEEGPGRGALANMAWARMIAWHKCIAAKPDRPPQMNMNAFYTQLKKVLKNKNNPAFQASAADKKFLKILEAGANEAGVLDKISEKTKA